MAANLSELVARNAEFPSLICSSPSVCYLIEVTIEAPKVVSDIR